MDRFAAMAWAAGVPGIGHARLNVLAVRYQPEAAGDLHRRWEGGQAILGVALKRAFFRL